MDANRKLEQFMEAVSRSTDEQIAEAAAHADEEAARILAEAQQRCAAEAERDLESAKQRIDMKYKKRLSQVGYRGRTSLLSRRQNMLLSLFAELRARLTEFTETDAYRDWMTGIVRNRKPEVGTVILLREADLPLGETLSAAAGGGVSFRADPVIVLGGLSLLSPDGRRCENHTLDEAFSMQLREFYRKHSIGDGGNA